MKLSELANIYDRLRRARSDPQRVHLLAEVFRQADRKTLETVAHFTLGELVDPQLTDKLGRGHAHFS